MNQIVSIVNTSTVISNEALAAMLPALQEQLDRDFTPLWGIAATLVAMPQPAAGMYTIRLQDHCDIKTDLGYHIDPNGVPTALVGAQDALQDGQSVSSVISHELLEMLVDPTADRMLGDYIMEVCDPVEQDTYQIGSITVSSFVTPRYFGMTQIGHFDQLGYLQAGIPTLRPGGYMMFWNGTMWTSSFGRLRDGTLPWRADPDHGGRSLIRAMKTPLRKQFQLPN